MGINILLLTLGMILGALVSAQADFQFWISKGKKVNHPVRFIIRAIFIFLMWYILKIESYWGLFYAFSTFYLWFDPALNIIRDKDFFYVGRTALFDKWWPFNGKVLFIIELSLTLLTLYLTL